MNDTAIATETPALPADLAFRDRLAARLVLGQLARWKAGLITLQLPDGRALTYGDPASRRSVRVTVRSWKFFWRVLTAGDIGNAESYMAGEWEVSDLVELCSLFLIDQSMLDARSAWTWVNRARNRLIAWSQRNTLLGARRNIRRHYDLSNEFYRLFLDDSMSYSCAYFASPQATLAEAQRAKIERIARKLAPSPGDSVLEIGSGWGALAIHLARAYGCRVTTLTLSVEQHDLARQRVREAGLEDRVDVRLRDYREVEPPARRFDRIVSVEMLEAVGYRYLGTFFERCARLLAPHGRMVLQTITFPDQKFEAYRRDFDFIRKYIFPGGLCPSLFEIARAVKRRTDLRILEVEDIGPHYATTLRRWRERFLEAAGDVRRLGFDAAFVRMWEYYLACCEAAFAVRYLGDLQIVFGRPTSAP
jgi:cyclopropane-fatty-acyl-phospholipid synthase